MGHMGWIREAIDDGYVNKGDLLVIAVIILVSAALLLFQIGKAANGGRLILTVTVSGRQVERIWLDSKASKDFVVDLGNEEAIIRTEEGRVRVLPMKKHACPKGICSETGWISLPGQMIVCAPNKMVVRLEAIKGGTGEADYDAIVR